MEGLHDSNRARRIPAALALVALALPTAMAAEDWPEWRGSGRRGEWRETGLLERFPATGLRVRWRTPIGSGYAGPAVADGRVVVLDWLADPQSARLEGTERAVALDERSGDVLWTHSWPAGYGVLMGSYAIGPRATPTIDGDRVYVVGAVGDLLALDVRSGEPLWTRDYVEEFQTSVPTWGVATAPLVVDDLVITLVGGEPDAKVVAFDRASGDERWRALSSNWEMGYAQLVVYEVEGTPQLIVWEPQNLVALDPRSGRVLWSLPFDVPYGMTVATPVLGDAGLLVSQFYGGSMMVEPRAGGATMLWKGSSRSEMPDRTDGLHSLITTPILDGDLIVGVCSYGELRGLDARTGERLWMSREMTRQGRWGAAFMVRNGDRWIVNNDEGDLILARFSRRGYEEIDRTRLIEPTSRAGIGPRRSFDAVVNWSHPAYANGHVVARNDREILRASLLEE